MPLFEYRCTSCKHRFEQIVRGSDDPDAGTCPKCQERSGERLISRFRIGGQGDLRESTEFHGCHSALDGDHGHDHGSEDSGHVHGAGCGHGSPSNRSSSGDGE